LLRFLADENIESQLIAAIRRDHGIDIVRVQDVGLSGADDSAILDWVAREGGVLLTHDAETMADYAYNRMPAGLPMVRVFEGGVCGWGYTVTTPPTRDQVALSCSDSESYAEAI